MFNRKIILLLSGIFIISLVVRFLYFPSNIYFGFDQARDAFAAKEILGGDLKLIGPPTSFEGLHHGVLYYYLLAPLYGLGKMNPEFVAGALRILNSLGVFFIFLVSKTIFDKKVGLFAALLFAISFEQTQFSIYMGNPSPAILSILLMYLGLALFVFKKKNFGLPLALLGLGFSIQFQFALTYLIVPFILILLIFWERSIVILKSDKQKTLTLSAVALVVSLSTFIIAEFKYNFMSLYGLLSLSHFNTQKTISTIANTYFFTIGRMIKYNLVGHLEYIWLVGILILIVFLWFFRKKDYSKKLIFLGFWFFSLLVIFLVSGGVADLERNVPLYYPNVGGSIALLIFVSFILCKLYEKSNLISLIFILLIAYVNFNMITTLNPTGTISEIDVQQGMTLGDEKNVLDYIYQDSASKPFAVKAVTMPFFINTTWSYLFEWYGKEKYGYLPIWNGKNALGFPGDLKVEDAQDKAPPLRYLIIEPLRGIPAHLINDYLREESYFTDIDKEVKIGRFQVQVRHKK